MVFEFWHFAIIAFDTDKSLKRTDPVYRFYSLSHFKPRFNERRCSIFQDGRKLGFGGMHGIPMVASSPVRHESSIGMTPLEVQAYQPPWKALSDFALHTDLERLDPNTPSFHHLVSQVIIVDILQIKNEVPGIDRIFYERQ